MKTAFTRLLGIEFPIMQAPIGPAAGPELAAAVSNAGALGSLAAWVLPADQIASQVAAVRERTDRPVSWNFRADLDSHSRIFTAMANGARLIHLFYGDPTPYSASIRRGGAKLLCTVANDDEAKRALDVGADVLIAQGWEAGGHLRGTLTTLSLVPTILDLAGPTPVLAAGGIGDGRGLAAMLTLGAAGVVMGTRFVASEESRAHADYKKAVTTARQADAAYVEELFDIGWPHAPHRVLRNSTLRAWEAAGHPPSGARPNEGETVASRTDGTTIPRYAVSLPVTGMTGNIEAMAHYAGQSVELVRDILPAATIVDRTVQQASNALARHQA